MQQLDMLTWIVAIVAVIAAAYAVWKARAQGAPAGTGVATLLSDIQVAVGAAREWVMAAEQLYQSGRLTRGERFDYVLSRLKEAYPKLDEDTLAGSIEAAVRWLKLAQGRSMAVGELSTDDADLPPRLRPSILPQRPL